MGEKSTHRSVDIEKLSNIHTPFYDCTLNGKISNISHVKSQNKQTTKQTHELCLRTRQWI